MANTGDLVEEVKAALAGGIATQSTVANLQSLFGTTSPVPGTTTSTAKSSASTRTPKTAVTKTTSSRAGKTALPPARGAKKVAFLPVLEDEPKTLPPKSRYALATEIVNISLKVLQTAAKQERCSQADDAINGESTPRTSSSLSQRALQARSSNVSPAKSAPGQRSKSKSAAAPNPREASIQIVPWSATAECARLAFSQLRATDRQKLGVRALPKFQLETGMLSLVGRMIALGLDGLAAKELCAVKKRLQAEALATHSIEKNQPSSRTTKGTHETLASLLELQIDIEMRTEAAPLAMTYWSYVLHLLANSKKPLAIEEAIPYLELDQPGSAVSLIMKQSDTITDGSKAHKQLDALFLALMRFCPAVNISADDSARDRERSIRPLAAFKIHGIALAVRKKMLKLDECTQEITEPLSRALTALLRRLPPHEIDADAEVLDVCLKTCASLDFNPATTSPGSSSTAFTISRGISLLAEQTNASETACVYAQAAVDQCTGLEHNHARRIAGLARLCSSNAALGKSAKVSQVQSDDDLRVVVQALQQSLSGSATDYGSLLAELAHLLECFASGFSDDLQRSFTRAAATFASRYARLNPGKQIQSIKDIISRSLAVCRTTEDLLAWITKDTAQALSGSGTLREVSAWMAHESLVRAWSDSQSAVLLSRVLKGLITKAAASPAEKSISIIYDDESLTPGERGAALEWQLQAAFELAHKTKYRRSLNSMIPNILHRLMAVYDAPTFPIRRARVAAMMMRHRTLGGDAFTPKLLQAAESADSIDEDRLGQDEKLVTYLAEVRVSVAIARGFETGNLTPSAMEAHIEVWQRLLHGAHSVDALHRVIEHPRGFAQQLASLMDYFGMLGYSKIQLQLSCLASQLQQLLHDREQLCVSALYSVRAYLLQGYAEQAAVALEEAESYLSGADNTSLVALDFQITRAQYLLCVDKLDECNMALQRAAKVRSGLAVESVRSQQSKSYSLHHVRGWMVHSQYLFAAGNTEQALRAAKRSVKVANSIWAGLEKSSPISTMPSPQSQDEHVVRPVNTLVRGISKLNLKPVDENTARSSASQHSVGAAFWDVVPLMCQALMHLADVFTHHGVFLEANYASEHAIKVAEGVRSHELLSRVRYHRSMLLASAGRVEEAELCIAHEQDLDRLLSPLTKVQQLRAKATMSTKIGDHEDALTFLHKAEAIVKDVQSETYIASLGRSRVTGTAGSASKSAHAAVTASSATTKRSTTSRKLAKNPRPPPIKSAQKTVEVVVPKSNTAWGSCYALQKLEAQVMLQSTILAAKLGRSDGHTFAWLAEYCQIFPDSFSRRMFSYLAEMQQAEAAIGADFTFNALAESNIAFPALQTIDRRLSFVQSTLQPAVKKTTKTSKSGKGEKQTELSLLQMLLAARQQLQAKDSMPNLLTTSDTHKLYAALADTSILLSATSAAKATEVLHPVREAMNVELPRMHASQCLSVAAKLESDICRGSDLLLWPETDVASTKPQLCASEFRNDYVNIMPLPWTAVSLSLNDECDELYVARYHRDETPLLLRLPFSRQKSDDDSEDLFDFQVGRAELQEIIELSNYSCHNSMDSSVKGAKTNWWSEREALDRRLQELLINIENIWLGGFRGALSLHEKDDARLEQFRVSFDGMLDRHLPSRKVKGSKKIALDDQILELFIGLGTGLEDDADLDEPLADLLYFVVDMLQFNGERNAYDEIDFDSMAIDALDALRVYYDAQTGQNDAAHLILVLDRRLQAFPWESLPCLEKTSVSRVDSMLTLRERIVAMRNLTQGSQEDHIHTISRHSGAYVLNPSGDLKSTETSLAPELSKLVQADGAPWTSVVKREPSEEVFKAALQTSSNFLYFGHGAGSQYIRPRTIRKMDTCSDVVWLMGCSSGAATEYDELESCSVPLAYLQAGQVSSERPSKCMAVVATLWDVTDKDIDRFSLAVGQEWGLWQTAPESTKAPAKTPRKRTVAAATTLERGVKAPKTPKMRKTPAPARTPARSRSRVRIDDGKKQSLVEAVTKARDACFLRYLNGAAPVVYGVPVYLED
ncbi:Putative peptidase C50, separase, tetratricopeptide-like helical domain superfamily [Septoria linicola]|uniref:separase n=1 Tax=Septoria linicola TaxID=215465 RepID=A0A9Q9EGJ9_9PEZI|nr:putative peptidase C50, separase, tetratricopeptide-like helical domain superfamily [Septoria linicola]USW48348.1 Putative peptidase C50, separase, tetratricopeptide-like helical domain superfamily [Septoria linicola]